MLSVNSNVNREKKNIENINSKNWKKRFGYSNFYFSIIYSFFLALSYNLYDHLNLPSPINKIFSIDKNHSFFSFDSFVESTNLVSYVKFLRDFFFYSGDQNFNFLLKFLRSNFYSFVRIWKILKDNVFFNELRKKNIFAENAYLFFLLYSICFSINYITEMIINSIERQGVFDGYSLIFFFKRFLDYFLPITTCFKDYLISKEVNNLIPPVIFVYQFVSLTTILSLIFSKFNWKYPIENANFSFPFITAVNNGKIKPYYSENVNNQKLDFELRVYFSPYELNSFLFALDIFVFLLHFSSKFLFFNTKWEKIFSDFKSNIWNSSIILNSSKEKMFFSIITLFTFIVFKFFSECFLYSKEISFDLKRNGVYFNGIPFEDKTRSFLFKKLTKIFLIKILVFFSAFIFYEFLIFFFCHKKKLNSFSFPGFFQFFSFILVFIEIIGQIKSHKDFSRFYE